MDAVHGLSADQVLALFLGLATLADESSPDSLQVVATGAAA